MSLEIEKQQDGRYRVIGTDGNVRAENLSNADAWKFIDRHLDEPASKTEARSKWFWNNVETGKHFDGGFFIERPGRPCRGRNGDLIIPEKVSTAVSDKGALSGTIKDSH